MSKKIFCLLFIGACVAAYAPLISAEKPRIYLEARRYVEPDDDMLRYSKVHSKQHIGQWSLIVEVDGLNEEGEIIWRSGGDTDPSGPDIKPRRLTYVRGTSYIDIDSPRMDEIRRLRVTTPPGPRQHFRAHPVEVDISDASWIDAPGPIIPISLFVYPVKKIDKVFVIEQINGDGDMGYIGSSLMYDGYSSSVGSTEAQNGRFTHTIFADGSYTVSVASSRGIKGHGRHAVVVDDSEQVIRVPLRPLQLTARITMTDEDARRFAKIFSEIEHIEPLIGIDFDVYDMDDVDRSVVVIENRRTPARFELDGNDLVFHLSNLGLSGRYPGVFQVTNLRWIGRLVAKVANVPSDQSSQLVFTKEDLSPEGSSDLPKTVSASVDSIDFDFIEEYVERRIKRK